MKQDKKKEIDFFDQHAQIQDYDVFSEASNRKIVDTFIALTGLKPGALVADLGCGSGVFTELLRQRGYWCVGLDLSHGMLRTGRERFPDLEFVNGDVEALPFPSGSLDGVLLSGIVHHLLDPSRCACEVFRVLKRGSCFVAFDPNRLNPLMYLYRDKSSPFYSSKGVTENERPVVAKQVARVFEKAGFTVRTNYLSGMRYRYIASSALRWALPIYNFLDEMLFRPTFMRPFRAFVFTSGVKS